MRVTDERKDESVENTDLSKLRTQGWYVSGAYAITGERQVKHPGVLAITSRARRELFRPRGR